MSYTLRKYNTHIFVLSHNEFPLYDDCVNYIENKPHKLIYSVFEYNLSDVFTGHYFKVYYPDNYKNGENFQLRFAQSFIDIISHKWVFSSNTTINLIMNILYSDYKKDNSLYKIKGVEFNYGRRSDTPYLDMMRYDIIHNQITINVDYTTGRNYLTATIKLINLFDFNITEILNRCEYKNELFKSLIIPHNYIKIKKEDILYNIFITQIKLKRNFPKFN